MKLIFTTVGITALLAPFAAHAAPGSIAEIINIATQVVLLAVPTAALLLMFFWNLSQLLFTANDAEKRKQAKMRMIWSIIALFAVFSLGGLVAVLQTTFFPGEPSTIQGL